MNRLVVLLVVLSVLITGCGMSDTEKLNVAKVTCSIIAETRNMDAAVRVEKVNEAREKIGEEPFLRGDFAIKDSIKHGVCPQLVLNDPNYKSLLKRKRAEMDERERVARERSEQRQKEREEQQRLEEQQNRERKENTIATVLSKLETMSGRVLLQCERGVKVFFDLENEVVARFGYADNAESILSQKIEKDPSGFRTIRFTTRNAYGIKVGSVEYGEPMVFDLEGWNYGGEDFIEGFEHLFRLSLTTPKGGRTTAGLIKIKCGTLYIE